MSGNRILVVDDDQDLCELLGVHLSGEGHTVSFASDGMTGLAKAQRERPNLIILDLGLPAGDGLTTLKRLRDLPHLAKIPVIVLTGRAGERWRDEARQGGANAYLQKPINKSTLLGAVRGFLAPAEESGSPESTLRCIQCGAEQQNPTVKLDQGSIQAIATALRDAQLVQEPSSF